MDVRPWLDRSSVRTRLPSSDKASAEQVLCLMFIRPSTLSLLGNVLSLVVDGCNTDTSPGSIDLLVLEFINKTQLRAVAAGIICTLIREGKLRHTASYLERLTRTVPRAFHSLALNQTLHVTLFRQSQSCLEVSCSFTNQMQGYRWHFSSESVAQGS